MKFAQITLLTTVALLLAAAAPTMAEGATRITLQSGHSTILDEDGIQRVAVGDAEIAGVLPVGSRQLVINGKRTGRTTLIVWTRSGREEYEIRVAAQGTIDFAQVLQSAIPYADVKAFSLGNNVILRGTVDNGEDLSKINEIVKAFSNGVPIAPGAGGKDEKFGVINLVVVKHPLGNLQTELKAIPGVDHLRVDADEKGDIIVSGAVEDRVAAERVLGHVRGLAAPYLSIDGKIVDRLEVAENTEIDIKVQVLEVDKSAQNQIGLSLQSAILDPQSGQYTYGPSQFPIIEGPNAKISGKGFTTSSSYFRLSFLAPTITALINHGDAKILSEPHLTTVPGQAAEFLVGGEIPYITSTTLGQVTVSFKEYGVHLNITPTIMPNGSISTVVAPEISDLDYQDAVTLNGFSVPALKTSKLSTVAISRPGESIVLGGMLQHVEQRAISEFPILGQLPILGKLFRSTNYQSHQSDVMFVLTPEIVNH